MRDSEEGSDLEEYIRNRNQMYDLEDDDSDGPYGANLFFNIIGQVQGGIADDFGYDMANYHNVFDYDSDTDDFFDDMYAGDYFDDEDEDDKARIFVTLQDSHVIGRLSFFKDYEGKFRLPRVNCHSKECYEDLYRLLQEVELLTRVWKARLEHPYTAHLKDREQASSNSLTQTGAESLLEGEDYLHTDYEREGSCDEMLLGSALPKVAPNETLTKKKYCQSVRLYHQIFDSNKQFDAFLHSLIRMKKTIFELIFQLFLEVLPPATVSSLPGELWEKIWKHTQNGYFIYDSCLPLLEDKDYFKAGLRASPENGPLLSMEQARLRDLFGSVGNMHMILFEILYKDRGIVWSSSSPMEELERHTTQGASNRRIRSLWWRHSCILMRNYARFKRLDYLFNSAQAEETQQTGDAGGPNLLHKIEQGIYVIRNVPTAAKGMYLASFGGHKTCVKRGVPLAADALFRPSAYYLADKEEQAVMNRRLQLVAKNELADLNVAPACALIVSPLECNVIALPGHYNNGSLLALLLIEVNSGKLLHVVKTGLKDILFQMNVVSSTVRREGKTMWKRQFYLTRDRLSFLYSDTPGQGGPVLRYWSLALPRDSGECFSVLAMPDPLLVVPLPTTEVNPSTSTQQSISSVLAHNEEKLILSIWNGKDSVVNVYDATGGELLLSIEFPAEPLELVSFKDNRALLLNRDTRCLRFFSTDSGETITTFSSSGSDGADSSSDFWSGIFSSSSSQEEFVLWNSSLTKLKLFSYNPRNEVAVPELLLVADFMENVSADVMNNAKLLDGLLFFNRSWAARDADLLSHSPSHDISAFSLRSQCCHSLVTLSSNASATVPITTHLNELNFRHADPPALLGVCGVTTRTFEPETRPLFVAGRLRVGLLQEIVENFKIFDFSMEERSEVEAELDSLKQSRGLAEEKNKTKTTQLQKYLNTALRLTGLVIDWRGTYGFISCSGPESCLGRIFFHRQDLDRSYARQRLCNGTRLEFNLMPGRDPGTLRGVQVKPV